MKLRLRWRLCESLEGNALKAILLALALASVLAGAGRGIAAPGPTLAAPPVEPPAPPAPEPFNPATRAPRSVAAESRQVEAAGPLAAKVDRARVHKAIANARHFLIRQLDEQSGRCLLEYDEKSLWYGWETALVLYALSTAGEKYQDSPVLRQGYQWLLAQPRNGTSLVAMRVLAVSAVERKDGQLWRCLADDAAWLLEAASAEGYYSHTSEYGKKGGPYHNACADWATMALAAAAHQDVLIPAEFWRRNARAWWRAQLPSGGWKYYPQDTAGPQYGANFTMTAAGLCALRLCKARLQEGVLSDYERRSLAEGDRNGMAWLKRQFRLPPPRHRGDHCYTSYYFPGQGPGTFNPGTERRWHWLLNLSRLRLLTGQDRLGGVDLYHFLARQIVADQNDDGSWGGGTWSGGIFKIQLTALATLFLAEAGGDRCVGASDPL